MGSADGPGVRLVVFLSGCKLRCLYCHNPEDAFFDVEKQRDVGFVHRETPMIVVAKNVSKDRCPNCEFLWEAPDGTKVFATRLGEHARANFFMNAFLAITTDKDYNSNEYFMKLGKGGQIYHEADGNGYWEDYFVIDDTGEIHENRLKDAIRLAWSSMDDTLLPDNRLLMNGSDSSTAQPQLVEIIKKAQELFPDLELKLSTLEEYVDDFKKLVDESKLKTIRGELRDGPAFKCSANALATRPRIKILNKQKDILHHLMNIKIWY